MTDSSGNLSVDFLVGFTIFMVAFIWIATLVPNLLIGVSAHGVDFDAVAYRTGVILTEDPGQTVEGILTPWELERDSGKKNIARFGLAVSKETPNLLSETKVNRFFCSTVFSYPDDYREKVIFGDYPYRFNISLLEVGEAKARYVGDILPGSSYGFIRREVKVKHYSSALINRSDYLQGILEKSAFNNTANVSSHDFSIMINTNRLIGGNITNPVTNPNFDPAYQIDPRYDRITITIENLSDSPPRYSWMPNGPVVIPASGDPEINLTSVSFSQSEYGYGGLSVLPPGRVPHLNFTYDDGNTTPVNPPVTLMDNVTFVFEPGFFINAKENGAIYINLTFGINETAYPRGLGFLNNTRTRPWEYDYNPVNVTQPVLREAVLEVAVW